MHPRPPDDQAPEDVAATFCSTLVDEWVRRGVRHAVVAPGSRSTPLALALAERDDLAVHVHVDERSAAFTALGIGAATGVPAIVLTTSGTAAVELHPAVVEAHQQGVPLLAVTANRPPELQGVGAPQTIDQRELFGGAVRWFCEPGPPDAAGWSWWRRLAADVVDRSTGEPPGPVHLDLAFREPLVGVAGELPPCEELVPAPGFRFGVLDEQLGRIAASLAGRRVVVVAGARAAADGDEATAILDLAEAAGWPVLADHLSGVRRDHPSVITTFDALLRTPMADELRPEVVIRLGALLASRVANEWMVAHGAAQIGVDRWGLVAHPGFGLADELRADPGELAVQLRRVLEGTPAPPDWTEAWRSAEVAARGAVDAHRSGEPAVAAAALSGVPEGGALVVSSSMPVRDLEWYGPPRDGVRVLSNRGANGIDGVTSTAVGVALTGLPTVCLVGDLAFLHDTNALLGLARRDVDLAVVVTDNDGGAIFSFLPQATSLDPPRFEQLFGTPQGVDLVALARAHGLDVRRLDPSPSDAGAAVAAELSDWSAPGGVRVLVVGSDRAANVAAHRAIHAAVAAAVAPTTA